MKKSTLPPYHVTPLPYPHRFGWKMRLFLTFFLFCLVYRCLSVLFPMSDWCAAYAIKELPPPLPSPAERTALEAQADENNPFPVAAACMRTADGIWDFMRPWPGRQSRLRVQSTLDAAKCTACWLCGRVLLLERLCGLDERWPLYAPSVDTYIDHLRARLCFGDGTELIVRQRAEPADFTHFTHYFEERIVNNEYVVCYEYQDGNDDRHCWAYCNLLAQRHAHSAKGSPLVKIVLFQVGVMLVPPREDALAHYQEQIRRTASPPRIPGTFYSDPRRAARQVFPDGYEFDAATKEGRWLESPPQ